MPASSNVIGENMSIKSRYGSGKISNILKNLEDKNVLYVIDLSCASNDLASNVEVLNTFPQGESEYFFYNSISIVREIAKLIKELSASELKNYFSLDTVKTFEELATDLTPFDDGSLSKSVLIPIRNHNFHYNFHQSKSDKTISKLISKLKEMKNLSVDFKATDDTLLSIRYTYADWFRTEYMNSHLNSASVQQITAITVKIISFVDSLLKDLLPNNDEAP